MTAVHDETTLETPVDVRFTLDGTPLAIRHDGHIWAVAADPLRWFEREPWWHTQTRAPIGVDVVNVKVWRVQVRINTASPLRTMEIRRRPLTDHWVLSSIDDTVQGQAGENVKDVFKNQIHQKHPTKDGVPKRDAILLSYQSTPPPPLETAPSAANAL